jgi:hypothetical protein
MVREPFALKGGIAASEIDFSTGFPQFTHPVRVFEQLIDKGE